jgi:hypothetical protein
MAEIIDYKMKDDAVFMREYVVSIDSSSNSDSIPEKDFSIFLIANTTYRYILKGSSKCNCEPILTLIDKNGVVLDSTGYQKGKKVAQFEIKILNSTDYRLNFKFKNGKSGCAVAGMFYVPANNKIQPTKKNKK